MSALGLSFGIPALLGLFFAAPLIILAYLNRSPRKEKLVSSLLLLRQLPKAPVIRQKIKIPPLFFLELLILLITAFLASYPSYRSSGNRIALVLDNSLSMRARERDTTRFDLAKEELNTWLRTRNPQDRFTLFVSSPRMRRTSGELVDAGAIVAAEESAKFSSSPDYLEEGISQIIASSKYDKIFVVTDKQASFSGGGESFPVEARTVGELVPNIALSNLRYDRKTNSAIASIALYGAKTATAKLQAYVGGELIAESPVTLEPRRAVEGRLTLPRSTKELVRIEVVLSEPDVIYMDNVGYLLESGAQTKNMLLVTPEEDRTTALGLDKLGAQAISPDGFAKMGEDIRKEYRTVIFHKLCPSPPPPVPSLFIYPPADCDLFPSSRDLIAPVLSSWKPDNSITSYINFNLIKLGRSVVFNAPEWAETILSSEQGAVMVAGEREGVRIAATGFELLPFEGNVTPAMSILTLNTLSYLSSGGELQDTMRTGSPIPVPEFDLAQGLVESWQLLLPAGEIVRSENWKDNDGPPRADAPGLYKLVTKKKEKLLVANSFHPDESATDERGNFEASYPVEEGEVKSFDSDLWKSVLGALLLLLAADLLIRLIMLFRDRALLIPSRQPERKRSSDSKARGQQVGNA